MMRAYFDASYTEPGKTYTAVACGVSTVDRWNRFGIAWSSAIEDMNTNLKKPICYFHTTDFMAKRGLYHPSNGLTDDLHQEFLQRFLTTIIDDVSFCTATCIATDDFNSAKAAFDSFRKRHLRLIIEEWTTKNQRKHEKNMAMIFHSPFAICVYACLNTISEWADRMEKSNPEIYFTNGIQYLFEHESKITKPINNIEQIILSTNPELGLKQKYRWAGYEIIPKTKPPDEMDWKIPLPLQAADLVAYEWRKDQMNTASPNSSEHVPARFPLLALLHGIDRQQYLKGVDLFSFGVFGQEQISELLEFANLVLREEYNL